MAKQALGCFRLLLLGECFEYGFRGSPNTKQKKTLDIYLQVCFKQLISYRFGFREGPACEEPFTLGLWFSLEVPNKRNHGKIQKHTKTQT